jgi:hypothetical protein
MKVSRFVENGLPNCLFGQSCPIIRESALSEVTEQNRQTSGLLECLALCDALYQLEPIIICTAPKAVAFVGTQARFVGDRTFRFADR